MPSMPGGGVVQVGASCMEVSGQALFPGLVPGDRGTEVKHEHAWGRGGTGARISRNQVPGVGRRPSLLRGSRRADQTGLGGEGGGQRDPALPGPARPGGGCLCSLAG